MTLQAGTPAPDFTLPDENGEQHSLSDFRGKPLVLYFYPKDDTKGCTTEACGFRDDYSAYQQAGVEIVGISPDSSKSHMKFKNKYELPFTLLADVGHQVADQYGVWGRKKFMGREYDGIFRTTFLIDMDGKIRKVFEKVRPAGHSAEILASLNDN